MSELLVSSEAGIDVVLELPTEGELDAHVAETVAAGVSQENMRGVTPQEILGSFATYTAWHFDKTGPTVAGFLRQRTEDNYAFPLYLPDLTGRGGEPEVIHTYVINELGTLWVNPVYRGRQFAVADTLVGAASTFMQEFSVRRERSLLPVAVCNPGGRKVFERWGFDRVGTIGEDRAVMALPPGDEWGELMWYFAGFREQVTRGMAGIERFAGLTACEFGEEQVAFRHVLASDHGLEKLVA